MDVSVSQVDVLEALQFQARAISNEIQEKHPDVGSGNEESHELKMQLGECSKKIKALREQQPNIFSQVGDRVVHYQ